MKWVLPAMILFFLMSAGSLSAQSRPVRLYLAPSSTVSAADVIKNLDNKCSNVSVTVNSRNSDFMLQAGGWSGSYRFVVFQHGGQAVFSTSTVLLSNAVKDVCHFVNGPRNY